jgi:hypothetical protein
MRVTEIGKSRFLPYLTICVWGVYIVNDIRSPGQIEIHTLLKITSQGLVRLSLQKVYYFENAVSTAHAHLIF